MVNGVVVSRAQILARLAGVFLFSAVMACSTSTAPASTLGQYSLVSINGTALPAVFAQTASEKDEATSGSLNLGSSGSWTISLDLRVTVGSSVTTRTSSFTGTWSQSSDTFMLRDNADQTLTNGTYSGGSFTTTKGGATLVFQHVAGT